MVKLPISIHLLKSNCEHDLTMTHAVLISTCFKSKFSKDHSVLIQNKLSAHKGYLAAMFVHREGPAVWGGDAVPIAVNAVHQPVMPGRPTAVQGGILDRKRKNQPYENLKHTYKKIIQFQMSLYNMVQMYSFKMGQAMGPHTFSS